MNTSLLCWFEVKRRRHRTWLRSVLSSKWLSDLRKSTSSITSSAIDIDQIGQLNTNATTVDVAEDGLMVLAEQRGVTITKVEDDTVLPYGCSVAVEKFGHRVTRAEAQALQLVQKHMNVPSPRLLDTYFGDWTGQIVMSYIPGRCLDEVWVAMDEHNKERLCVELWKIINDLRSVPRSAVAEGFFVCLADGSVSIDPLLKDIQQPAQPIRNDDELRARIYERYHHFNGRKYKKILPDMLPRASKSVFTHADLAPHNVMVSEDYQITGIWTGRDQGGIRITGNWQE